MEKNCFYAEKIVPGICVSVVLHNYAAEMHYCFIQNFLCNKELGELVSLESYANRNYPQKCRKLHKRLIDADADKLLQKCWKMVRHRIFKF